MEFMPRLACPKENFALEKDGLTSQKCEALLFCYSGIDIIDCSFVIFSL